MSLAGICTMISKWDQYTSYDYDKLVGVITLVVVKTAINPYFFFVYFASSLKFQPTTY